MPIHRISIFDPHAGGARKESCRTASTSFGGEERGFSECFTGDGRFRLSCKSKCTSSEAKNKSSKC